MKTLRGFHPHHSVMRAYTLGALGTIVEWFDFSIYGHLSSVFTRIFFVNEKPWLSLTLVYAIFFISYLARPIGALLYGYIGDQFGRRPALLLSIFMMTISMLAMMLLPTWHTVGNFAPLLLLIFRIVQGLSAGGETTGAFVYILESVNRKRYGLFGGLTLGIISFGILLGSATVTLLTSFLSDSQLLDWGWRSAYLIGAIMGFAILLLRTFMPESPAFLASQLPDNQQALYETDTPVLKAVFYTHYRTLLMIIFVAALASTYTYFTFFYFPQYTHKYLHIKLSWVMAANTAFIIIEIFLEIVFGLLADRIGKKRLMMTSIICFLLFSYPVMKLTLMGVTNALIIMPLVLTTMGAMYDAPMPGVMIELAPLKIRYTLVSLGYNISVAFFGGATMLTSTLLIHWLHTPLAPAFYLMIVAALSLSVLLLLRRRQPTSDLHDNALQLSPSTANTRQD